MVKIMSETIGSILNGHPVIKTRMPDNKGDEVLLNRNNKQQLYMYIQNFLIFNIELLNLSNHLHITKSVILCLQHIHSALFA